MSVVAAKVVSAERWIDRPGVAKPTTNEKSQLVGSDGRPVGMQSPPPSCHQQWQPVDPELPTAMFPPQHSGHAAAPPPGNCHAQPPLLHGVGHGVGHQHYPLQQAPIGVEQQPWPEVAAPQSCPQEVLTTQDIDDLCEVLGPILEAGQTTPSGGNTLNGDLDQLDLPNYVAQLSTQIHWAQASTPHQMAQPNPPNYVAQPSTQTQLAQSSTPHQVAQLTTPHQVAQPNPPNYVAQPSTQTQLAQSSTPHEVAQLNPQNYVAQTGTQTQLAHSSTPSQVAQPNPPNYVAQPSTQINLAQSSTPHEVAQSSTPHEVAQSSTPHQVAQSSTPHQVAQSSTPHQVAQSCTPHQVAQSSTPHQVAQSSTPHQVAQSSTPHQVAQPSSQCVKTSRRKQNSTTTAGSHVVHEAAPSDDKVTPAKKNQKKAPTKKRPRAKATKTKARETADPPSLELKEVKRSKKSATAVRPTQEGSNRLQELEDPDANELKVQLYYQSNQVFTGGSLKNRGGYLMYHQKPCQFPQAAPNVTNIEFPELSKVELRRGMTDKREAATKQLLVALAKGIHIVCDDNGNICARRFCRSHVYCYSTIMEEGFQPVRNTADQPPRDPRHQRYVQELPQNKALTVFNKKNFSVRLLAAIRVNVLPQVPTLYFTFGQPWEAGFPISNCLVYMVVKPQHARYQRKCLNQGEEESFECNESILATSMSTLSLKSS